MTEMQVAETVEVRCPACRRFLAETASHARAVCADCGWEVTVRSPQIRKEHGRPS